MNSWKRKALKDAAKTFIPLQRELRSLKRHWVPYREDPSNNKLALRQGLQQISMLRSAGFKISGTVLEFGSGWMPIIPKLFYLAGADTLILTDIERLIDKNTLAAVDEVISNEIELVCEHIGESKSTALQRLKHFSYDYLVPWNPKNTDDSSVDFIISRATLEHVPENSIRYFLAEFRRILKRDGAMAHVIDNSDHWEHGDKSISRVNFLTLDHNDFWWKIACRNPQNYQNRLRHSDYRLLFEAFGWRVSDEQAECDAKTLAILPDLSIATSFRNKCDSDLATLTSFFVLNRQGDCIQ